VGGEVIQNLTEKPGTTNKRGGGRTRHLEVQRLQERWLGDLAVDVAGREFGHLSRKQRGSTIPVWDRRE